MALKAIGDLGSVEKISVAGVNGGYQLISDSRIKILWGTANSTNYYSTLRESDGSAGYTPGVGKTFKVKAVRVQNKGVGGIYAGTRLLVATGDAGINSSSAPTGIVYHEYGTASFFPYYVSSAEIAGGSNDKTYLSSIEISNGQYIAMQGDVGGQLCWVIGIEE